MTPGEVVGREGLRSAVPIVHAVTSDNVVAREDFVDVACAVLLALGARGALHLRAPRMPAVRYEALARGLAGIQASTGGWLVVSDRVDIAMETGARGVQLSSRSVSTAQARAMTRQLAIGASVHDVDEGVAAARAGADWLVAGHVMATVSEPVLAPPGVSWIDALIMQAKLPVIAIGGIRPEHAPRLRMAGVHGVAVIRGIWDAPNAEQAASDYLSAYDDAGVT